MNVTPKDLSRLAQDLEDFLVRAGWSQVRKANGLRFFYPPESLGIQGKYSVGLPENVAQPGIESLLSATANSLVEIYGYGSVGDLLDKSSSLSDLSRPTQITSRFIDGSTQRGLMPLSSLVTYVSNIEASLYRSAKFKLGSESKEALQIARDFANDCFFAQTEMGSFIAKIEIPHAVLRQGDLFGVEPLISSEITSSLFSAIQFINEKILGDQGDFDSPEILGNAILLFDVDLLESLTKTMISPKMETIDFSLQIGNQHRVSSTGWITHEKKSRLEGFLLFIRDHFLGEDNLDVSGSIVELRSRDPEGNRNYIRVVSEFHGDRVFITAALSNEQYKRALDAHRNKWEVRITGSGIRLKTHIKLHEVTDFTY